jgi:hypothetical protein
MVSAAEMQAYLLVGVNIDCSASGHNTEPWRGGRTWCMDSCLYEAKVTV